MTPYYRYVSIADPFVMLKIKGRTLCPWLDDCAGVAESMRTGWVMLSKKGWIHIITWLWSTPSCPGISAFKASGLSNLQSRIWCNSFFVWKDPNDIGERTQQSKKWTCEWHVKAHILGNPACRGRAQATDQPTLRRIIITTQHHHNNSMP
jgi:hypothetical protein